MEQLRLLQVGFLWGFFLFFQPFSKGYRILGPALSVLCYMSSVPPQVRGAETKVVKPLEKLRMLQVGLLESGFYRYLLAPLPFF